MGKYLTNELCGCSMVKCDKGQRSRPKKRERIWNFENELKRVNTVVHCGPWSEEKRIFLYGVVMQQCSGHSDEDVDTISGGECHGTHMMSAIVTPIVQQARRRGRRHYQWGRMSRVALGECYRDSIGTPMRVRGSLSVDGRRLESWNGLSWSGCMAEGYFGYFRRLREESEEGKNTGTFVMRRRMQRN